LILLHYQNIHVLVIIHILVNYSIVKYICYIYMIFLNIINNLLPTDISNQNILFTILYFYSYEKITFHLSVLILITNVSEIKLL